MSLRDLAARKTLALFGRAEARDFTDVYDLARRFGRDQLLDWAAEDDPELDNHIFASMLIADFGYQRLAFTEPGAEGV